MTEFKKSTKFKNKLVNFQKSDTYKVFKNQNKVLLKELDLYLQDPDKCTIDNVKKWASGTSRPRNGRQQDALDNLIDISHWQSRFKDCNEAVDYIYSIWDNWIYLLKDIRDSLSENDTGSQMFYSENTVEKFLLNCINNLPQLKEILDLMFGISLDLYTVLSLRQSKVSDVDLKKELSKYLYDQVEIFRTSLKDFQIDDMNNFYASLVRNAIKVLPQFITESGKEGLIFEFMNKVPNASEISNHEYEKDYEDLEENDLRRRFIDGMEIINYAGVDDFEVINELLVEAEFIKKLFLSFRKLAKKDSKHNEAFSDLFIKRYMENNLFNISDNEQKDVFNCSSEIIIIWLKSLSNVLNKLGKHYCYIPTIL